MLKIVSIEMEAFRSAEDRQVIEGLPASGLIGVDGFNKVTGGSSGAGKSTFLNAIAYVTGISPFPATKQQNLYTQVAMCVVLTCKDDEGREIKIMRGRDSFVWIDGKTHVVGATKVDEFVKSLFGGISNKMLQALTHRRQRDRGMFVNMPASDRQKFLSKVIGLDEVETLLQTLKDKKKNQSDMAEEHERTVQMFRSVLSDAPTPPGTVTVVLESTGEMVPVEQFDERLANIKANAERFFPYNQEKITKLKNEISECEEKYANEKQAFMAQRAKIEHAIENLSSQKVDPDSAEEIRKLEQETINLTALLNEGLQRRQEAGKAHDTKVAALNLEARPHFLKASQINNLTKALTKTEAEITRLEDEVMTLEKQECPMCRRAWHDSECNTTLTTILGKIKVLEESERLSKESIKESLSAQEAVERYNELIKTEDRASEATDLKFSTFLYQIDKEIDGKKNQIKEIVRICESREHPHLAEMRKQKREVDSSLNNLHADFLDSMTELGKAIDELEKDRQTTQNRIRDFEQAGKYAKASFEQAKTRYEADLYAHKGRQQKLDAAISTLEQKKQDLALTEDALACTRGYLNAITEEILNDITIETNTLLGKLKNVGTTTVRFSIEETVRAGLPQYSIGIIAERDGSEMDFDANLSGGQQASTELAIDLAIVTVLDKRQAGKVPGWMMIDEAFEGHEPITKEGCLSVLQAFAQNRQVFVIDHASEFKEYYICKVVAEYDGKKTQFGVVK